MAESGERTRALQDQLRDDYVARLPQRRAAIMEAWRTMIGGGWSPDAATGFHRMVHGLTGSGLTFGFPELTDSARAVEHLLQEIIAAGKPPGAAAIPEMDAELHRLEALIGAIVEAGTTGGGTGRGCAV